MMNAKAGYFNRLLRPSLLRNIGYYLLILSLPLIFKPWGLLYLPTGNRLALPLLIVPLLSCASILLISRARQARIISYVFPLAFILGGCLWAVLADGGNPRGIELFLKLVLLLGLTISIALLAPSPRALRIGVFYLALVVGFMVSLELSKVFAGQIKLVNIMRGLRGQNATAYSLLVLTPFPLLAAALSSSRLSKLGLGLVAILLITGLFYTYSRGGIIALPLGLLTAILLVPGSRGGRRYLLWAIIMVIVVDSLLTFTAPELLKEELASSLDVTERRYQTSNLDRLVLLKAGLRIIWAHPLSGIGLGRFDDVLPDYITGEEASLLAHPAYSSSHNQYVHIWNEGGLIAFIGFVWLLVSLFRGLRTAQVIDTQPLLLACIALWAGSIWYFLTETPANLEMFWGTLGITLASLKFSKPKAE